MTTKPKVVAYHINKDNPEHKGVTLEPLIRLAEYEALQAECEKLRKLATECADYLDTNDMTSIGHGSILHCKLIDAAIQETANQRAKHLAPGTDYKRCEYYTAPQPTEQKPRSDALIVEQTEQIAALLAKAFQGSQLTEGVTFRDCENPKAKQCWDVACRIQEELTATDVENALAELEDDQQPAPDVSALVEALEWLRGAINATPENDKVQAGTWISAKHPRIKQIDKILAAYRNQGGE